MSIAFDTLKYVRRLREAGVPERQAEAEAEAIKDVLNEALDAQVATKADILKLENRIQAVESSLRTDIRLMQWMLGVIFIVIVFPLIRDFLA